MAIITKACWFHLIIRRYITRITIILIGGLIMEQQSALSTSQLHLQKLFVTSSAQPMVPN